MKIHADHITDSIRTILGKMNQTEEIPAAAFGDEQILNHFRADKFRLIYAAENALASYTEAEQRLEQEVRDFIQTVEMDELHLNQI